MRLAANRTALAALAAAAAFAVAGCGDDEEETTAAGEETAAPSAEADATVEVVETDFALDPKDATVEEDGTIEFQVSNEGETTHSLEVETPQDEFVSDEISPGESTSFTAELDSGEYVWYCPIGNHRQLGMEGTVTVGGGGGGAGETEDDSGESEDDSAGTGAPY